MHCSYCIVYGILVLVLVVGPVLDHVRSISLLVGPSLSTYNGIFVCVGPTEVGLSVRVQKP